MAKIEINVDTTAKKVEVKVDGKKQANVRDIFIFTGENNSHFSVDIATEEPEGEDLVKLTRLVATAEKDLFKTDSTREQDGYSLEIYNILK